MVEISNQNRKNSTSDVLTLSITSNNHISHPLLLSHLLKTLIESIGVDFNLVHQNPHATQRHHIT